MNFAAQGAAASTGVPLTHRGLATGVRYVTGHRAKDSDLELDWASLASNETTLVVYMGVGSIREIAAKLMSHGLDRQTPVLMVASATTRREERRLSSLLRIGEDITAHAGTAPALFIIGQVVSLYRDAEHSPCVEEFVELALAADA